MSTSGSPDGAGAAALCQPSSSVESSGYTDPGPLYPSRSSLLSRRFLRLRGCSSHVSPVTRRKREMIPADKKDANYWDKRQKNNEAAKRSREKRRLNDLMLEGQLLALNDENAQLRAQVLSLQFHSSLSAEKSKATSVEASTLSLSPRAAHTPALFPAGLWGNSRSHPASALGVKHQETAIHPFEAKIPCFSPVGGVGGFNNPQSSHNGGPQQGLFPLSVPRVLSPRAVLEGGRSAEADVDAHRQVSSSDDIPNSTDASSHPASSTRAFLHTPDTLQHASILSYPPQNWLLPHLNHPAVCNNFLLPWRSPYLPPPAVYPGLPLYIQERQGQALGVDADSHRGLRSRLSSAPAVLSQLGMHLSLDGR
ncbi:uncharacterized protein si:dkey-172o19.2 [Micropterus salmoides]|uniref:uncharacterized protein si:dkey-172o19.2 n=1 Tax=Micropterus salmoides TaxID=27706 RepID=UPI0018EC5823|nr:uncharacterized protein si:dkey-172o19.2 [Micropterus salmoides]